MDTARRSEALALAEETLSLLELGEGSLTPIVLRSLRLARLLDNIDAATWFRLELQGYKADIASAWGRYAGFSGRQSGPPDADGNQRYWTEPLEQVEVLLELAREELRALTLPTNLPETSSNVNTWQQTDAEKVLTPILTQRMFKSNEIKKWSRIVATTRGALHEWLSRVTVQLGFGVVLESAFERAKRRTDQYLAEHAPDAARAFAAAFERARSDDPEEWSQALTSSRRAVKALADAIYPASDKPIDGHELTDDKYVNRLCRFVADRLESSSKRQLIVTTIESVAARAETLNDIASKGIHARVDEHELEVTLVQTYFLCGEMLSLLEPEQQTVPSISGSTSEGATSQDHGEARPAEEGA